MRHILAIANPTSGRGGAKQALPEIERRFRDAGFDITVRETRKRGDAERLAAEATDGDLIVAVGGDGTFNEVANGAPRSVPLYQIPFGTANLIASEFGMPRRIEDAVRGVTAGTVRDLDVVEVRAGESVRRCVIVAGAGFDAAVVREVSQIRGRRARGTIGMATYVLPIVKAAFGYAMPAIEVSIDGAKLADTATSVLVCNGRRYGGPFTVAPEAKPDDGLLDAVVIKGRSRLAYFKYPLAALLGFLLKLGSIEYHRCKKVELRSAETVYVQNDGDIAGTLPLTAEIREKAIKVLVP